MKKVLTIIIDGFGIREEQNGNAISEANMSCFNKLWKEYPHSLLDAMGKSIGLKEDELGNCEIGHKTIGAGRIIKQNETLVDEFLNSNVLENESFNKLLESKDKDIHLMGFCNNDIVRFYDLLVKNGCTKIHFHIITDGIDINNSTSYNYIKKIEDAINRNNIGDIATICGSNYAFNKDNNIEKTKVYYDLITSGNGYKVPKEYIKELIDKFHEKNIADEYIKPVLINENGIIKNGDTLVWLNYNNSSNKILSSFQKEFSDYPTINMEELNIFSLLKIDDSLPMINFVNEDIVKCPLGVYLSKLDLTQARVAEEEKFNYITNIFDSGYSGKINKCNTFLIPSPEVDSYDLKPEMSAVGITKKVIECMTQDYDFILMNFANPDMVGRTGNMDETVKACMAVDLCLNKILEAAEENFYKVIITSDHGNAELMINDNNEIVTTNTSSKVPFIIVDKSITLNQTGDLTMIAPTILEYMDIAVPEEMSETASLIK